MKPFEHSFETSASPAKVYATVTTPEGFHAWWCKDCDIASAVGGEHHMRFDKQGTRVDMHFEIERLVSNELVAWVCTKNDNPVWVGSRLRWQIAPQGAGAKVTFVHEDFADGGPSYEATMQGWVMFMKSLESVLAGDDGTPF